MNNTIYWASKPTKLAEDYTKGMGRDMHTHGVLAGVAVMIPESWWSTVCLSPGNQQTGVVTARLKVFSEPLMNPNASLRRPKYETVLSIRDLDLPAASVDFAAWCWVHLWEEAFGAVNSWKDGFPQSTFYHTLAGGSGYVFQGRDTENLNTLRRNRVRELLSFRASGSRNILDALFDDDTATAVDLMQEHFNSAPLHKSCKPKVLPTAKPVKDKGSVFLDLDV